MMEWAEHPRRRPSGQASVFFSDASALRACRMRMHVRALLPTSLHLMDREYGRADSFGKRGQVMGEFAPPRPP